MHSGGRRRLALNFKLVGEYQQQLIILRTIPKKMYGGGVDWKALV